MVKKGKQREVPKAKKPTPLKKASPFTQTCNIFKNVFCSLVSLFMSHPQVILKEREERKQRRLLEERGLPENKLKPSSDAAIEEQGDDTGESNHYRKHYKT